MANVFSFSRPEVIRRAYGNGVMSLILAGQMNQIDDHGREDAQVWGQVVVSNSEQDFEDFKARFSLDFRDPLDGTTLTDHAVHVRDKRVDAFFLLSSSHLGEILDLIRSRDFPEIAFEVRCEPGNATSKGDITDYFSARFIAQHTLRS